MNYPDWVEKHKEKSTSVKKKVRKQFDTYLIDMLQVLEVR